MPVRFPELQERTLDGGLLSLSIDNTTAVSTLWV